MAKNKEHQQSVYSTFLVKKEDGRLHFKNPAMKKMFDLWQDNLPAGAECELFYATIGGLGSAAKLARVNIMARTFANEVGITADEAKDLAKKKAGFTNAHGVLSSGDMSDGQLDTMAATLREMAAFVGLIL